MHYEDKYIIARYRVPLTEAEYKKTLATMRRNAGEFAGLARGALQLQPNSSGTSRRPWAYGPRAIRC